MSPPQIEAQPKDVVDVVTGTAAIFSVGIVCEDVGRSGGGGRRERVGSLTWEDLQITWEVFKTNSQSPTATNGEIGKIFYLPLLVQSA